MMKFKVGDNVKVTAGKDKGRQGTVERVIASSLKVIIPDVNIYKRHVKASQGQKGGIFEIPRPLPFSKIALVCPKCKKTARVGFGVVDGASVRICKKCGKEIDTKQK